MNDDCVGNFKTYQNDIVYYCNYCDKLFFDLKLFIL